MSAPENALQTVLFIQATFALPSATIDVHPPHDRPLPFVQLGNSTTDERADGRRVRMDVHTWSSKEGPHEVQDMQHAIRSQVQAQTFTQGGWRLYCIRETYSTVMLDVDGETWHGVQTIQAFAEQV